MSSQNDYFNKPEEIVAGLDTTYHCPTLRMDYRAPHLNTHRKFVMSEEGTPHKKRGVVDIVFLMDATGSMEECIDALKANVTTFVDSMCEPSQQNPVKDWRVKVVGFRDFHEDDEPLVDNPFVKEPAAISSQLAALEAMGGGDEPESLLDAIYHVAHMGQTDKSVQELDPNKWRYRSQAARVVIIFTDATYHPTTKEGGTLCDINFACIANRIHLFIFAPELDCFDDLCCIDRSEHEAIAIMEGESAAAAFERFTKDPTAFKKAMEQLGKSVSDFYFAEDRKVETVD